ncbi:MAG: hypothetical protein V1893_01980 [Candidatus Omnitrophota bacterium]
MTSNRISSWIAVLLYAVSPGLLSGVTFLFHQGKPITSFLAIFCLSLASKINISSESRKPISRDNLIRYYLLLAVLFISFLTDETAYFIFICTPVLFPNIFKSKNNKSLVLLYCSLFICFLLFATFISPIVIKKLGFRDFNYWSFIKDGYGDGVHRYNLLEALKISNFFLNSHYLISSHIVPFRRPDLSLFFKLDIYVYALFLGYAVTLFFIVSKNDRALLIRMWVALFLFSIFHSFIMARHLIVTTDCYYYGALFSLFLIMPFSILLSATHGVFKYINKVMLIILLVIFASNFNEINVRWFNMHRDGYKSWLPKETEHMLGDKALTYSMVLEAWKNRGKEEVLLRLEKQFCPDASWLFVELRYMKKKNSQ